MVLFSHSCCEFVPHIQFVLIALFAQTMVASLLYGFLNWLGHWGLVCQWWLWWWLGGVSSPLELASCWALLELGAHCWILCWVTVFPLVVWTILSKVTLFDVVWGTCCSVDGILFSSLSILCNASYSTSPSLFLFCFTAFVKFSLLYLLLLRWVVWCTYAWNELSDILLLLVFLT